LPKSKFHACAMSGALVDSLKVVGRASANILSSDNALGVCHVSYEEEDTCMPCVI
jgi:hypothetical protein